MPRKKNILGLLIKNKQAVTLLDETGRVFPLSEEWFWSYAVIKYPPEFRFMEKE